LLELNHLHGLRDVWIVDILHKNIIALLSDLLHGSDRLILVQDRVEAEVRELFREVMRWNSNHTIVRSLSLLFFLWHVQRTGDE
jgi:hypothetical protein